jgi:hypothetical protein
MLLEVQVPNVNVYYDLFEDLGLKPDTEKCYYRDLKYFVIDTSTKQFGANSQPRSSHTQCSIKEAIEFCVTGKLPEPKMYKYGELSVGDKFYHKDFPIALYEKMQSIDKIVKYRDQYSIVTNDMWLNVKCLIKV